VYRRELVRVYLSNVESVCRRFADDNRTTLAWMCEPGFAAFWHSLQPEAQRKLTSQRMDVVLKVLLQIVVLVQHARWRRQMLVDAELTPQTRQGLNHAKYPQLHTALIAEVQVIIMAQTRLHVLRLAASICAGLGEAVFQREGGHIHAGYGRGVRRLLYAARCQHETLGGASGNGLCCFRGAGVTERVTSWLQHGMQWKL
jgi:hypothetical protein